MKVIKRNGTEVVFDITKIIAAVFLVLTFVLNLF